MRGYTQIDMAFLAAVLVHPPPFPAHLRNVTNGTITRTNTTSREGVRP